MLGKDGIREVELRPRPAFLEREGQSEVRTQATTQVTRPTSSQAPLPRQDEGLRRRGAAGARSAGPPAGVIASPAAEPPAGAAASSNAASAAAGPSRCCTTASPCRTSCAANDPAANQANNNGGAQVIQYPIRPRRGIYARTFHISESGERFHNWETCHGLRHARHVRTVQLCTICVDPDYQIGEEMFTSSGDTDLHSSWAHSVAFSIRPSRGLTPCKLCMR